MSFRNKGLVLAMEELENGGTDSETELVPASAAEVEAGAAEVSEQADSVEEVTQATDDAGEDVQALSDVKDVMEESVEKGEGLDETSAALAEVAVESICARLGIKTYGRALPSVESFGSKSSRLTATKVAIESIGEKIKTIWTAILNALQVVWDKIKSFFLSFVKHRNSLKKHLEGLKERASKMTGEIEDKEIEGGVAKAVAIEQKADSSTIESILTTSLNMVKLSGTITTAMKTYASGLLTVQGETSGGAEKLHDTFTKTATAAITGLGNEKAGKDGVKLYGTLPHNRAVAITEASGDKEFNLTIEDRSEKVAEKATTLNKQQIISTLTTAIDVVSKLSELDKTEKVLESVKKTCEQLGKQLIATIGKPGDDKAATEAQEVAQKLGKKVSKLNGLIGKFGTSIPGQVFSAAKVAGDYAAASMRAHKAKEAKKD
jgi:hypothetical protein